MPMDRDEFHIKQMDPNELKNWMARNKRKTTPIISRLDQTNKNNTSGLKKQTKDKKICIENSAICRASKEIKTKHKRETCPEGHQNKTEKPFKKQN